MEDLVARIIGFVIPLLPGFVLGFVLGSLAKKALATALMIAAGVAVVLFLAAQMGGDVSFVADWLKAGSSWAGDNLSSLGQKIAAVLPPVAALVIGFKVGMSR